MLKLMNTHKPVATKSILKQLGQDRVAVRNHNFLLSTRNISQCLHQTKIDCVTFVLQQKAYLLVILQQNLFDRATYHGPDEWYY